MAFSLYGRRHAHKTGGEGRGREGERTPLNQNHDKCLTFTPHGGGTGIAFCDLSSCYNFDLCYA